MDGRAHSKTNGTHGGSMHKVVQWLLSPLIRLLEGSYTSGIETCEYMGRLSRVPRADTREGRRAA